MELPDPDALSRREYLRRLVAVGGMAGLSACVESPEAQTVPTGDPANRPSRQHAWNDVLETDENGNHVPPQHHVLVSLRLQSTPDETTRETVESAFRSLERAYAYDPDGLLFTVGYTPSYFETVGTDAPIPEPTEITDIESPSFDTFDAVVHLASNEASVVLAAEEALFGEISQPNGVEMSATLTDVFERTAHRRTGFIGAGLPARHTDVDGVPDSVPEETPLFMGFRSGFVANQAPEDRVTVQEGPYAGGTTMHIESLDLKLQTWRNQDNQHQRVSKMFSPTHADEDLVGKIGEKLDGSNRVTEAIADRTEEDASEQGMVGHAQKAARARDEDGTPPLLRRDFNTVDNDSPGIHFLALHRTIDDFVRTRTAMAGEDLAGDGVGTRLNNGILQYIFVTRRGNYILPPREKRSLPAV